MKKRALVFAAVALAFIACGIGIVRAQGCGAHPRYNSSMAGGSADGIHTGNPSTTASRPEAFNASKNDRTQEERHGGKEHRSTRQKWLVQVSQVRRGDLDGSGRGLIDFYSGKKAHTAPVMITGTRKDVESLLQGLLDKIRTESETKEGTKRVTVLTIDHKHGTNIYACGNEEVAKREVFKYVEENWGPGRMA